MSLSFFELSEFSGELPKKTDIEKVAYSLVYLTDFKLCWLIGSGALFVSAKGSLNSPYRNMVREEKTEYGTVIRMQRDLDFVMERCYVSVFFEKLERLGKMTILSENDTAYIPMMRQRGIISIKKVKWVMRPSFFHNPCSIEEELIYQFCDKFPNIEIMMDLIVIDKDLPLTVGKWLIPEMKRNIAVAKSNRDNVNKISYFEIVSLNPEYEPLDLTQSSVGNLIEAIKHYLHRYNNDIPMMTKSGDVIKILKYNKQLVKEMFMVSEIATKLNFLHSGYSMELVKYMKIPNIFRVEKVKEEIKDSNCAICQENLDKKNNHVIILSCGHIFDSKCLLYQIQQYLMMMINRINKTYSKEDADSCNNRCPICRKYICKIKIKDTKFFNKALNIHDSMVYIKRVNLEQYNKNNKTELKVSDERLEELEECRFRECLGDEANSDDIEEVNDNIEEDN